jgi:hypothetical protein
MPYLEHPYTGLSGGSWLRGNLHAHTTRSDGAHAPQALVDAYAAAGYQFLAISDHDLIATADDYARWNSRGLILIPGNEITADGPHMLHINGSRTIVPDWIRQRCIDQANADGVVGRPSTGGLAASGTSGTSFIIINHPSWWQNCDHCPVALLLQWHGYLGMEIFNGATNMTLGNGYALDKWDQVLPAVVAQGGMVWGFASDDTHHPHDIGQGWIMAYAPAPGSAPDPGIAAAPGVAPVGGGVAEIVDALRRGRFYASTGVTIEAIEVEGMRVRIATRNAQRIVAVTAYGRRLKIADDRTMAIDVPGAADVPYVRFDCWGPGESFAWTQPFVVRGG